MTTSPTEAGVTRRRRYVAVVVAAVVLVAVALGVNLGLRGSMPTWLRVGDCIRITQTDQGPGYTKAACTRGDRPLVYVVGVVGDGPLTCPNANYTPFTQRTGGTDHSACLIPNVAEGRCYDVDSLTLRYSEVPCATSGSLKVVKTLSTLDTPCQPRQVSATFPAPEPGRLYCYERR